MRKWLIIAGILIVGGLLVAWQFYGRVYDPNTAFDAESTLFYIATGDDYSTVKQNLVSQGIITDAETFDWVAEKKKYPELVKAGRYRIHKNISNNELINKLRIGDQEAVSVTFNNIRTRDELAGALTRNLECDSLSLLNFINNPETAQKYGFNELTFSTMFIPNTYEMFWNSSAETVVERMAQAYKVFWDADRIAQAQRIGLSQSETAILASIVKAETSKSDEAPIIAGVYVNRLDIGMALQADPTLVFALGDFSITRVLDRHKQIDSPYNTYKYAGLPPGPINLPSPVYLDAVLNSEDHDYLYFCAKADFSGYHNFAKSYRQHLVYAREYQRALNNRRIYR